jgi:hypothetical protein
MEVNTVHESSASDLTSLKHSSTNCIIVLFVETPRRHTYTVYTYVHVHVHVHVRTPRGVSTNKTIIYFIAMQTYKEHSTNCIIYIVLKAYGPKVSEIGTFLTK